jgi:hypothetical protein
VDSFEWDLSERYRSNAGRGPLTARILCVDERGVHLEHWRTQRGPRSRCVLSLRYFTSPRCGWKKVKSHA